MILNLIYVLIINFIRLFNILKIIMSGGNVVLLLIIYVLDIVCGIFGGGINMVLLI